MCVVSPYREPPVTGPTSKRELLAARVRERLGGWPSMQLVLDWVFSGYFCVLFVALVLALTYVTVGGDLPRTWTIECPGKPAWTAPRASVRNGLIHTTDAQGREAILPATCKATQEGPTHGE